MDLRKGKILIVNPEPRYYYLVLQWPGSVPNKTYTSPCHLDYNFIVDFKIHGLRPADNVPRAKQTEAYDFDKIKDLTNELEQEWLSFCGTNTSFWKHVWDSHGVRTQFSLHDYFRFTLNLRKKINISAGLHRSGIQIGRPYAARRIRNCIENSTGSRPWIEYESSSDGHIHIGRIFLCVDELGNFVSPPNFLRPPILHAQDDDMLLTIPYY